MRSTLSTLLILSLLSSSFVGCASPTAPAAEDGVSLLMETLYADGSTRTVDVQASAGSEELAGLETTTRGGETETVDVRYPIALAAFAQHIREDNGSFYLDVEGVRLPVTSFERREGFAQMEFNMGADRVRYTMTGEVPHNILILAALLAIAAGYCGYIQNRAFNECKRINGYWEFESWAAFCSGRCRKQ